MHIAIIGCGNMGSGIAKILHSMHHLTLYSRYPASAQILASQIQAVACQELALAIEEADWIILAVKPQNLKEFAPQLAPLLKSHQVLISLLAGTSYATLKQYFPHSLLVRMMPNLALIYKQGVIGLVENPDLTDKLKLQLQSVFELLGTLYWLPEFKIDALTALTGSGPAFIFALVEAIIEAGIYMGFQASDAKLLTIGMLKGTLALLEHSSQHPAELKWQIASPAGTTIEGLKTLEDYAMRSGMIHTFLAAYRRAQEISLS